MTDTLLEGMRDGAWLDAQVFPPLEYAVPGIIPEGFGLLVAPPKAGKSWFVATIGLACAVGGLALGRLNVTPRPVLYFALEDGHRRLQARCRRLMMGDAIPAGINFITKASTPLVIPMMTEFLHLHAGRTPLIVLDTLGKVKPPKPAGADSYQVDYAIGAQLKECIDSVPGASLLVVHHTRKAESTDFVDAVSGTAGIAGSADFVLVLARQRHSDEALLSVTGRDVVEAEYAMRCDDGLWVLDGENLQATAQTANARRDNRKLGDRALDVITLVNSREETRAADLAAIGIDADQARVYLSRLADSGRITKSGRGIYRGVISVSTVTGTLDITDETQITDTGNGMERQRVIAEKLATLPTGVSS